MDEVLIEIDSHVATLTLNRPDRLNAITPAMLDRLSELLLRCDADGDVRVIVLTGAGRGFCAGLDLKDLAAGKNIGSDASMGIGRFDLRSAPPIVLHQVDKPTICALNGAAAGYGMDLALGCDVRVASSSAKLAAAFTKRGVLPESGGTWLLPRLVGWAKACEIAFTGQTLDANACLALGLVNRVVEDPELARSVRDLAVEMASNAPLAVQATKRMMRLGLEESFEANVHHVFLQLLPLFRSKDFGEGVRAYLERRPPRFEGR
ncbi:2-(1,2-epoxy-1,2-dihydrophenyl)acetyl-CoA isomerase [Myxococcaceae bacterium]|jgi:enoyl-CoA hydratase/carnithine racemase|nr:2-(1,2-epoxy-1,2-dihydrophenyl)acetyl-CoA isomerase [Myxococcaceae bacterium]